MSANWSREANHLRDMTQWCDVHVANVQTAACVNCRNEHLRVGKTCLQLLVSNVYILPFEDYIHTVVYVSTKHPPVGIRDERV